MLRNNTIIYKYLYGFRNQNFICLGHVYFHSLSKIKLFGSLGVNHLEFVISFIQSFLNCMLIA